MARIRPRRAVTLCNPEITPNRGPTRLWAYGYADLARLFNMSLPAVRKTIARGKLDPANMLDVIEFFLSRKPLLPRRFAA